MVLDQIQHPLGRDSVLLQHAQLLVGLDRLAAAAGRCHLRQTRSRCRPVVAPELPGEFGMDRQLPQLTAARIATGGWNAVAAAAAAGSVAHGVGEQSRGGPPSVGRATGGGSPTIASAEFLQSWLALRFTRGRRASDAAPAAPG